MAAPSTSATPAPPAGRRLQYQVPVTSYPGSSSHHQYQYQQQQSQQQQQPQLQGSSSSNSIRRVGATASSSSSVMGPPSPLSHQQQQLRRPMPMGYAHAPSRGGMGGGGFGMAQGSGSSMMGQYQGNNFLNNTHLTQQTQMGTTTNTAITTTVTNTNTMQAGTTGTAAKPRRKKEKTPRIPPPDKIIDNTEKPPKRYFRGPILGELYAEIKVHKSMTHVNIVRFYNCFEDDSFVYLRLELCENNTLMDMNKRRKRLTEPEVRFFLREIVAGCAYMHDNKIIHRDLKLGNIFLTSDMHIRIGDFGLAAVILTEGERKKTICGTPNYIAPEILFDTDNGHSFEVDIWSIGIIMYTLLIGKPPFQTPDVKVIYKRIRDNNYVFPDDIPISPDARNLISSLLNPSPASRPSVMDVLSHPFFTCGYCPDSLDPRYLQVPPNFELEERRFQWQLERQHAQDEQRALQQQQLKRLSIVGNDELDMRKKSEDPTFGSISQARRPTSQKKLPQHQLHYDQTSFGDTSTFGQRPGSPLENREPMRTSESTRTGSHNDKDRSKQTPDSSSAPPSLSNSSRHVQQQSGPAAQAPNPRLHFGEQVRMEMMEGDHVVSEIRTVNVNRVPARPTTNLQQYSMAHSRQQQQYTARGSNISRAASLIQQSQQLSATQSGIMQHSSQSINTRQNRHETSAMSASVPTLTGSTSSSTNGIVSRLPVPKSRQQSTLQQQSGASQPRTPTRSGFTSSISSISSPRQMSAATMGTSTPNLSGLAKPTAVESQETLSEAQKTPLPQSPSTHTMNRRRSSDMASIPGGPTFGKTLLNRRQPKSWLVPVKTESEDDGNMVNPFYSPVVTGTPTRSSSGVSRQELDDARLQYRERAMDLMETDVEMDMDMDHGDVPEHLDMVVDKIASDIPPPPKPFSGALVQYQGVSVRASQRQQTGLPSPHQHSQETFGQQGSQGRSLPLFKRGLNRELGSGSGSVASASSSGGNTIIAPTLSSPTATLIQNVQGVERPASAMQRTYSQGRELMETNRGLESQSNQQQQQQQQQQGQNRTEDLQLRSQQKQSPLQRRNQQAKEIREQHRSSRTQPSIAPSSASQPEPVASSVSHDGSHPQHSQPQSHEYHRYAQKDDVFQEQSFVHGTSHVARSPSLPMENSAPPVSVNLLSSPTADAEYQLSLHQQTEEMRKSSFANNYSDNHGNQMSNNNAIKQSNETTMAGMSSGSGGQYSDEQDHVEVPSTSYGTATSLSISMHHEHPLQKQKLQQQLQEQQRLYEKYQQRLNEKDQQEMEHGEYYQDHQFALHATTSPLLSQQRYPVDTEPTYLLDLDKGNRRPGCREGIERHLRNMIQLRQQKELGLPNFDKPAPHAPKVFVTRWISYDKYGIGWQLTNGIMGAQLNDNIAIILAPNQQ
ncbi:Cell cycle serine/threonine-protein kinase cdc5/MSD2 [Mortierella polycephala]|uniref:Cell cycle serine/threonine-protein kinase cdc5/MSD2 n=1 Tax=Mortierella polycephala TaxID=41804 RepID=A0A9P6PQ09_9FUNG|nr:Cell cycle serine/threonine-protein kinase cdc5/MSD2 [Mortierella polycephala]